MRLLIGLLAFVLTTSCGAEGPPALFPLSGSSVAADDTPYKGVEHVRATLKAAGVEPSDLAVIDTDAGPVVGFSLQPGAASKLWNMDAAIWHRIGASLVLCGEDDCLAETKQHIESSSQSTKAILEDAEKVSLQEWAGDLRRSDAAYYTPDRRADTNLTPKNHKPSEIWASVLDEPLQNPAAFVIPSPHSWTAPAYLLFGGWNECPNPEVQVAFARYLRGAVGAEFAALRYDSVRYRVATPPNSKEESIRLAWEAFLYCPDAVHQGTGTLEDLAEQLMGSNQIEFWWD